MKNLIQKLAYIGSSIATITLTSCASKNINYSAERFERILINQGYTINTEIKNKIREAWDRSSQEDKAKIIQIYTDPEKYLSSLSEKDKKDLKRFIDKKEAEEFDGNFLWINPKNMKLSDLLILHEFYVPYRVN